jgi:hypothetical protein
MIITFDDTVKGEFVERLGYQIDSEGYLRKKGKLVKDVFFKSSIKYVDIGGFIEEGVFGNDIPSLIRYNDYAKGKKVSK